MKNKLKVFSYLITSSLLFSLFFDTVNAKEANVIAIEKDDVLNKINITKKIETIYNTKIRTDMSLTSEVVDIISKGAVIDKYVLIGEWYQIIYKNQICYIHSSCVKEKIEYDMIDTFIKKMYLTNDEVLIDFDNNVYMIPKYECVDVYGEENGLFLVKTVNVIGYMNKKNLKELSDTYVIVDISEQKLELYSNDELILETPIVSGLPTKSRESDLGIFSIYSITNNRYLVGPNYKTYVDVMMKYNGGEGLHDAEYHTNSDGFKHGWREKGEFGGNTYLTNGSHGCINMPHDAALNTYEHVKIGTKVLVKK